MTNAEYIEAIGARCSRRTYSHTPPDPRVLEILQEMVDAVNRQSGLSFRLLADGTAPFTLFTGKFALVAVCGPDTEWVRIQSGYFGESIVLQCVYHGLGTCWVTGTYNENKLYQMLDLPRDLRLYGVITGWQRQTVALFCSKTGALPRSCPGQQTGCPGGCHTPQKQKCR